MSSQVKAYPVVGLTLEDYYTQLVEAPLHLEAELEQKLNQLRAMSRVPQYLKQQAEAQLKTMYRASTLETRATV